MRFRSLWFVFALGCGGTSPPPVAAKVDPTPIIAEADRQLAKSFELEDRAPREDVRGELRRAAVAGYAQACELGDPRSCWQVIYHAAILAPEVDPAARQLVAHCTAGAPTSCRVVRTSAKRVFANAGFAGEACKAGVGAACRYAWTQDMTDAQERALSERGCELGDPPSCLWLDPDGAPSARTTTLFEQDCARGYPTACTSEAQAARLQTLVEQGCDEGLLDECRIVAYPSQWNRSAGPVDAKVRARALQRECSQRGRLCRDLAMLHRAATKTLPGALPDADAERDAFEHMCQYHRTGGEAGCAALAAMYEAGELPEPRPGRSYALRDHGCVTDPTACRR